MKTKQLILFILILFFCSLYSCYTDENRPQNWAKSLTLDELPNLYKINDNLYRGAQPTREGFINLQKLGIKTVINLREEASDIKLIQGLPFKYYEIPINAWEMKEEYIKTFLSIATNPENQPVFFHCLHGADRTGTLAAFYRIIVQDWPKQEALQEMVNGGYGFHSIFQNLISFVKNADVASYKHKK